MIFFCFFLFFFLLTFVSYIKTVVINNGGVIIGMRMLFLRLRRQRHHSCPTLYYPYRGIASSHCRWADSAVKSSHCRWADSAVKSAAAGHCCDYASSRSSSRWADAAVASSSHASAGIRTVALFPTAAGAYMTDCSSHAEGTMVMLLVTMAFFHLLVPSFRGQCDTTASSSPATVTW